MKTSDVRPGGATKTFLEWQANIACSSKRRNDRTLHWQECRFWFLKIQDCSR